MSQNEAKQYELKWGKINQIYHGKTKHYEPKQSKTNQICSLKRKTRQNKTKLLMKNQKKALQIKKDKMNQKDIANQNEAK